MTSFGCCHYCTKRVVGCHGTCDEYKEEQQAHKQAKEEQKKQSPHWRASRAGVVKTHVPVALKGQSTKR